MIYNLIRFLILPFIILSLIFKPKKIKFFLERYFPNLSVIKEDRDYNWIHCSSVGEVNLLNGFIGELLKQDKSDILLTTFTDTGFETAKNRYKDEDRITILKFPLDNYFVIKRILKRVKLKSLILVETEIWYNLINQVFKKAKIYLINGRISDRSFSRYQKIGFFITPLLKKFDALLMQSKNDFDNIIKLGADKDRTFITGNLKFDIVFEKYEKSEREELRNLINPQSKKIFVVGSSRDGEEEILIELVDRVENLLLIFVPRHLERVKEIETIMNKSGKRYKKYSDILEGESADNIDVLIVDKMGVLRKFYSIADYCFVGGTLVNIGGHSLLEPLYYNKPVIFGKYTQNVKEISKEILELNIGFRVDSVEGVVEIIKDNKLSSISSERIEEFFQKNKDAVKKSLKIMEERWRND